MGFEPEGTGSEGAGRLRSGEKHGQVDSDVASTEIVFSTVGLGFFFVCRRNVRCVFCSDKMCLL